MTWTGPIPMPPDSVLTTNDRRRAWEIGQSATSPDEATRSALALLLRPMAESLAGIQRKTAA